LSLQAWFEKHADTLNNPEKFASKWTRKDAIKKYCYLFEDNMDEKDNGIYFLTEILTNVQYVKELKLFQLRDAYMTVHNRFRTAYPCMDPKNILSLQAWFEKHADTLNNPDKMMSFLTTATTTTTTTKRGKEQ